MSRRVPLPHPLDSRPFTTAEGTSAGLTLGRLRAADLARPFHGVRTSGAAASTLDRVRAAAVRLQDGAFFSHVTAAELHGLPLPWRLTAPGRPLDVCVPATNGSNSG